MYFELKCWFCFSCRLNVRPHPCWVSISSRRPRIKQSAGIRVLHIWRTWEKLPLVQVGRQRTQSRLASGAEWAAGLLSNSPHSRGPFWPDIVERGVGHVLGVKTIARHSPGPLRAVNGFFGRPETNSPGRIFRFNYAIRTLTPRWLLCSTRAPSSLILVPTRDTSSITSLRGYCHQTIMLCI